MRSALLWFSFFFAFQAVLAQVDEKVTSAAIAYEQGDYQKALQYLDEALMDPGKLKEANVPKAYYYRAEARMKAMLAAAASADAGKYGQAPILAYEDLKQARLSDNGSWTAKVIDSEEALFLPLLQGGLSYLNSAAQYGENTDQLYERALLYLNPAAELNPGNYLVFDLRGQAFLGKKDTVAAYQDFKKTVSTFSTRPSPQPDMLVAYVHYRIALLERYHYRNPDNALQAIAEGKAQADSEWQRVLGKKELFNQAQLDRYAEQYQNVKSDLSSLELDIYLNFPEKKKEALEKFEQALREEPDNYIKTVAYAQLLEEDNPEKARQVYRRAIEIDPNYSLAYFNLGAMYNNEAGEWYRKANEAGNQKLAMEYQQKGQEALRAALPLLEKVYSLEPDNTTTLRALCQICVNLDEMEKYQFYWEKLKALE